MTEDFSVAAGLACWRDGGLRIAASPNDEPRRSSPTGGLVLNAMPGKDRLGRTGRNSPEERLQERVLTNGADSMADYELLEMLLFPVLRLGDRKRVVTAVIDRFGSFAKIISAPVRELLEIPGLGPRAVAAIKVAQASAVRLARAEVMEGPVLNNWDRLICYLNAVMARQPVEQFRVLFLDKRNHLLADEILARGTVDHTPVYPREVMKRALELYATALILVHNHPSGDPTPSDEDIYMTRDVNRAASVLSIALHDHIIVGNGRWISFRQGGLLTA
jgi:DNA repair protein RadC